MKTAIQKQAKLEGLKNNFVNEKIISFLHSLKDWQNHFRIQEFVNFDKNNSEVSNIITMEIEGDTKGLVDFWKQQVNRKYFELSHPIFNIKTRGVKSIFAYNLNNFIFMIDEEQKYPWIFIQDSELLGMFICEQTIFVSPYKAKRHMKACMDFLCDIDLTNFFIYEDIEWEFNLQCNRPGHFFYTYLVNLQAINYAKEVQNIPMFFIPKQMKISNSNDKLTLHPKTIGIMTQLSKLDSEYYQTLVNNINTQIYKQALADFDKFMIQDEKKYDLTLWFGLAAEKREWVGWIQNCINILMEYSKYFNRIKIFFDGMTAFDQLTEQFISTDRIFQSFKLAIDKLNKKKIYINVISLNGKNYRTKIACCSICDIAISEGNTTGIIPFQFCRKGGVIFDTVGMERFYKLAGIENLHFVPKNEIHFDETELRKEDVATRNYKLDYKLVFNLSANALEKSKNTNIQRL